jgi:hypothetical protein
MCLVILGTPRGGGHGELRRPRPWPARPFIYSTLLRRRNTITPKKTSAKTAHKRRIIDVSILGSPFAANWEGALHIHHHGDEIPHDAHQHRSYRHYEQ